VGHTEATARNVGPYGHENLAGNVWERVADWYHPKVYRAGRVDPTGPTSGEAHVLRGGSWNTFSTNMRVANRFTDNLEGSAVGARCARSRTTGTADEVEAIPYVTVSGTVRSARPLVGVALHVTAFEAPTSGTTLPRGASPAAEWSAAPSGGDEQAFSLRVPAGGRYLVMAALDAGAPPPGAGYQPAAGTGGVGQLAGVLEAKGDVAGILVELRR
jgi:hypothetical protein